MMLNRTNLILFGVFVVVIAIASYPWWKPFLPLRDEPVVPLDFSGFTAETVDEIVIRQPGSDERRLQKNGENWKISGEKADSETVKKFLGDFSSLKVEGLAGKNPENHDRFGVTDDKGIVVSPRSGDVVTIFVIGSSGTTANSLYIRQENSDDVYQVVGSISTYLSFTPAQWKAKKQQSGSIQPSPAL